MPERRALACAAAASLALHVLLLALGFPLHDSMSARRPGPTVIAGRLAGPPAVVPIPLSTEVEPQPPRRMAPSGTKIRAPAAQAEPLPPAMEEAGSVAQYRFQLAGVAARHHRYPPLALENGWQGDVLVRVRVAAGGAVRDVSVRASSGYEVLDEQALESLRAAMAEAPVPRALWGGEFSFELRASYDLAQPSR